MTIIVSVIIFSCIHGICGVLQREQQDNVILNWNRATELEAMHFLTKYELCMFYTNSYHPLCQSLENKSSVGNECAIFSTGPGYNKGLLHVCPNPMAQLLKHTSTKPWPKSMNIVDIISALKCRSSNTMVFIGDSVTEQQFLDSYCSAKRYGFYQVDLNTLFQNDNFSKFRIILMNDKDDLFSNFKFNKSNYFDVYFLKFCAGSFTEVNSVLKEQIFPMIKSNEKITYIFNVGIHYYNATKMKNEVTPIFQFLLNQHKLRNSILIYRETLAQHFRTQTGEYEKGLLRPRKIKISKGIKEEYNVTKVVSRLFSEWNRYHHRNLTDHLQSVSQIQDLSQVFTVSLPQNSLCKPFKDKNAIYLQNWRNRLIIDDILPRIDSRKHFKIAVSY